MTASSPHSTVDIWVDPACPWAWLTSRWLLEVARLRPITVRTRLLSLAEVNRGEEEGRLRDSHTAGERALRVLAAAGRAGGPEAVARLYTEIGEAYQERAEPLGEVATLEACLRAAGLDPALAAAVDDEEAHALLLEDHRAAVDAGAFGVPAISIDGCPPMFGPVVDVRLTGEDAAVLWDHASWLIRHGNFFELKRERRGRAHVGRYARQAA